MVIMLNYKHQTYRFNIFRICQLMFYGRTQQMGYSDLLPLTLPLVMYIFSGGSVISTLGMWLLIETIGSFTFSFLGYTTGHFHPNIFMDGDTPRYYHKRYSAFMKIEVCFALGRRKIETGGFYSLIVYPIDEKYWARNF